MQVQGIIKGIVNVGEDVKRICNQRNGLGQIEVSLENMKKMIGPRKGFVQVEEVTDLFARGGHRVDGYMNRYVNPVSGEAEHVLYNGNWVERVLYNAKGEPYACEEFTRMSGNDHCLMQGNVYVPAKDGTSALLKADGNAYSLGRDFNDLYKMDNYGTRRHGENSWLDNIPEYFKPTNVGSNINTIG